MNGTGIPDVDFDVGESYAGSLPITGDPNDPNQLFWWFFPSPNPAAEKEILIWLNGGVRSTHSPLPPRESELTVPARLLLLRGPPAGKRALPLAIRHV